MKLFEVEWYVSVNQHIGLQSGVNPRNKKAFTEKKKADDFASGLHDAAKTLGIMGSLECCIYDIEIE